MSSKSNVRVSQFYCASQETVRPHFTQLFIGVSYKGGCDVYHVYTVYMMHICIHVYFTAVLTLSNYMHETINLTCVLVSLYI